jgi:hypothetical protein
MRLANLRLPCTPLSDGYFGVLAGTFPLCQQPHRLLLTRSPGICPISSGQSKSKNAAPVPVRSFRLNQDPPRCRFTAAGVGRLPRFFIAYYRNGQRVRQSFSTIDEAKREAQVAARQIAAGLAKATGLSIAEREAYDAAKAILEAARCTCGFGEPDRHEDGVVGSGYGRPAG